MPFILVLIFSAVNFRNKDSDLDGITVVVTAVGPLANETTIDPSLLYPSVTETKHPFSNLTICKEKLRLPKLMVFCENLSGKLNAKVNTS
jgi:hypothetical protein